MHRFVMKAAGSSKAQIADRIRKFEELKLPPSIELHLFGLDDIGEKAGDIVSNCSGHSGCEYLVHFPLSDAKRGYLFDMFNDETRNFEKALDLCERLGSRKLIMHRCYGFDADIGRAQSEEAFYGRVVEWDALAKECQVKILYENYGHAWLPGGLKKKFVVSALDHFFPWEIRAFNGRLTRDGLNNTEILLDIAHIAISSNMFNMLKAYPSLRADRRYAGIFQEDLKMADTLKIEDYVFDFVDYFHISDSLVWSKEKGIGHMQKFLETEGLPIGKGDIDFEKIINSLHGDKVLVMEIEPEDGDYGNNNAQLEAIKYFENMLKRRANTCA